MSVSARIAHARPSLQSALNAATDSPIARCSAQKANADGVVMFKLFLMRNIQFPLEGLRPYALVNFGGFTLRTGIAVPSKTVPDTLEFDGRELLFKVVKYTIYQGYPPLRLTFFNQTSSRSGGGADDFLGALDIPISHRTASSFDVKTMKLTHDDYEIGEVLFGFFPVIPEFKDAGSALGCSNNSETSAANSSSTSRGWNPLRKDKQKSRAKKEHELVRKFVEETVSPVKVLSDSSKNSLLQLLDLFKHQESRLLFYNELKYQTEAVKLSQAAFQSLLDVFRAVLREANNHHDFYTCKLFLDLSMSLKVSEEGNVGCFLYSRVKNHEVFRNGQFWELTFLDVVASERLKVFDETELESFGTSWNELTSVEQERHTNREHLMVIHLLCVFTWQMLNASVAAEDVCSFCSKMAKVHQLDDITTSRLRQFVMTLNVCGETTEGCSWSANPNTNIEMFKSPSMDLESCLSCDDLGFGSALIEQCFEEDADGNRKLESRDTWTHYQTAEGIDYYHNEETNETRWDCPPSFEAVETTEVESLPSNVGSSLENSGFLLIGEIHVLTIYNAINVNVKPHMNGRLTLTNFRVVFFPSSEQTFNSSDAHDQENCTDLNELPVHALHRFEVVKGDPFALILVLKDLQQLRFLAHVKSSTRTDQTLERFCKLVAKYAWPKRIEQLFAFFYKQSVSIADDGWNVYHADTEYKRQGAANSPYWRKCTLNTDFEFSPTYPKVLYVPTGIRSDALVRIKNFRSKGRVPVLSYFCASSGGSILRSAQPRVGITNKRCTDDEELCRLAGVRYIVDARPKRNAVGNTAMGGGYEDVDNYPQCELLFMLIENIHVMRESLRALVEQVSTSASIEARDDYLASLASNGWLRHVRQVLIAACKTAVKCSQKAASVLVHCSDGWDRTSQITSLAMLMIDPYYRTIRGFAVLIEKEWLSFGHKFAQRHGHGNSNCNDTQRSPVFIQFLDCVWQMLQQFPVAFEFQEELLFTIAHEVFSCRFGTFLFNCERERVTNRLKKKTVSLWTLILCEQKYINPFYSESRSVLLPNCGMRCIGLFPFYCRMDQTWSIPSAFQALSVRVREMFSETRIAQLDADIAREREARSLSEQREQQLLQAMRILQGERDRAQALLPENLREPATDWLQILDDGPTPCYETCDGLDDDMTPGGPNDVAPPPPPLPADEYEDHDADEDPRYSYSDAASSSYYQDDIQYEYVDGEMGIPPPPPPEEDNDDEDIDGEYPEVEAAHSRRPTSVASSLHMQELSEHIRRRRTHGNSVSNSHMYISAT